MKKQRKRKLDREDWYFSDIQEADRKACFIYEYARELAWQYPAKLDQILKSEGMPVVRSRPRSKQDFGKVLRDCIPDLLRISKGNFPETPWKKLEENVRRMLIEAASKTLPDDLYLRDETTQADIRNVSTTSLEAFQWNNQPFVENEYLTQTPNGLKINFDKSDAGIKKAFGDWLLKERKRRGLPDIKETAQTGRGGYFDRLNALGALRQVRHCAARPEQLVNYTKKTLKYEGSFQNMRELRAAAEKAEEVLKLL